MELFAHTYHHLWGLPVTVLRFFNVYGPHGRPDMMPWKWTQQILKEEPLTLYNGGRLKRDWTYIDDIVAGFLAALDARLPYEILNLGCSRPVENIHFVQILEQLLDRKARIIDEPAPASEPLITYADVTKARRLLGYEPEVNVEEGLARLVEWLRREQLV
jgi:UDP-glucuronate 4-epimerase